MYVHVPDTEGMPNGPAAKQRDLEHDLPRFIPYDITSVVVLKGIKDRPWN